MLSISLTFLKDNNIVNFCLRSFSEDANERGNNIKFET